MVYGGKPSRGCQMCRTRRVKCDETKPSCLKCLKSQRQCPGYKQLLPTTGRSQSLEEWIDGATICKGSSSVGFVWSLYEACLHFLTKLVPLVSKEAFTASVKTTLNEEIGRLFSWGDGFESGELDKVLERDPEIKMTALEYLSSLGSLLVNKLLIVSTLEDVPSSELETKAAELRSLVNDAKTIVDDPEDESDLESDTGAKFSNQTAMLDEIASDIRFYNLRLMDLLPSIERTALQPKDATESNKDLTSIASIPFQVSKPAHAYVLQIRDKFPEAETKLVERLGQANWERRKRLRESQADVSETAFNDPAKSVFVPVSMFHDSGFGSSNPAVSAYAPTAVSHSSFRTSATESQLGSYRVPPLPKEVFASKPFTCEICGHILKNIKNRVEWKVHVFADLKPYICTSSSCPDEFSTFPTRQMWADHEFRKHRVEKLWRCHLCPNHFSSPKLWGSHIKRIHRTNLSRDESQKAISTAEITNEIPVEPQACPMCMKVGMKTRKEFVTHVAKHLESISLAALPRDADSDSESDIERGNNSVESEDEPEDDELRSSSSPELSSPPHSFSDPGSPAIDVVDVPDDGMGGDVVEPSDLARSAAMTDTAQQVRQNLPQTQQTSSYWTVPEQTDFPALLQHFGTDWQAIAKRMGSKTHIMVKNYYMRQIDTGRSDIEEIAKIADDQRTRGESTGPPPIATVPIKRRYISPGPPQRPSS